MPRNLPVSNAGEIIKPPKAFPDVKESEVVLIFSTGGRKFIGIGQALRPNPDDMPDVFRDVYELKDLPSMVPSKLVGGQPDMAIQSFTIFPDMGAFTGEPIQGLEVSHLDWLYVPSKKAMEIIEQKIGALKLQAEMAKRVQQQ